VSSSTIESLKHRSTSDRLRAVFVHASGNEPVHVELSAHQFTRESGRDRFASCPWICQFIRRSSASLTLKEANMRRTHLSVHLHMSSAVNRERRRFLKQAMAVLLTLGANCSLFALITN
jgi:hypothetical protein